MNNPLTTPELYRLLSLCIGKEKPASAYAVAKVLGCTQSCAKNWELGQRVMDENHAEKVAGMLGLELDFVVLSLQAERANKSNMDRIAAIFERAALASLHHAAALVLSVFLLISATVPAPAQAAGSVFFNASDYTLCALCRRLFKRLSQITHGHGWPRPAAVWLFRPVI